MGNSLPCCGGKECQATRLGDRAEFVGTRVEAGRPSDSDHNAILFTLERGGGEPMRILSWNVLCQYGYNEEYGFPFDGFNRRSETEPHYIARLHRTATEVRNLVEATGPAAVLLQECPEPEEFGHGVLTQQLSAELGPLGYTVLEQGEFVTAVLGAGAATVPLPALRRQGRKLHAVACRQLGCVVLNVHLAWDKWLSEGARLTRQDLEAVVAHVRTCHPGADVYLAGDTNRVPAHGIRTDLEAATIEQLTDGLGDVCFPPGPTNVRWNSDLGTSEMTYADFALRMK